MSMVNIKVRRQSFKNFLCRWRGSGDASCRCYGGKKKLRRPESNPGIADGERTAIMAALMLAYENDKNRQRQR